MELIYLHSTTSSSIKMFENILKLFSSFIRVKNFNLKEDTITNAGQGMNNVYAYLVMIVFI